MKNVLGICNLHNCPSLGALTSKRPLGSVSFLGRYGLMDFALSNLSNSGIERIDVLIENNVKAISNHILGGQIWINNTKTGFLRTYFNEKEACNAGFNTDVNNLIEQVADYIESSADYVVMTNPYMLMSMDFRQFKEGHIEENCEVTLIYKKVTDADKNFIHCSTLKIDDCGFVKDFGINNGNKKEANIALDSYIFTKDAILKILKRAHETSLLFTLKDALIYLVRKGEIKIKAREFDGYVASIMSLDDYVKTSFSLLDYSNRSKLFINNWPIYTTSHNSSPVLYSETAEVKNSFIANGSIIKGKVTNSILSRNVIVEEGAKISNSIIFTDSIIGKNANISYVLTDKKVQIIEKKNIKGNKEELFYIPQGAII